MSVKGKPKPPKNEAAQTSKSTSVAGALDGISPTKSERSEARKARRIAEGKVVGKTAADRRCKSLVVIANLLDCEGFTEYHAQHVLKFAQKDPLFGKSLEQKRESFQDAMRDATPEARRAIGRFVAAQGKAQFLAGLKIGLMSHLTLTERA